MGLAKTVGEGLQTLASLCRGLKTSTDEAASPRRDSSSAFGGLRMTAMSLCACLRLAGFEWQ
jgi:hypothetical protein